MQKQVIRELKRALIGSAVLAAFIAVTWLTQGLLLIVFFLLFAGWTMMFIFDMAKEIAKDEGR